jgi:membrane protein
MDLDMWWTVLKEAATKWSSHKDARQGAALAYYSVFSLGPIIVIAIAVAGLLFGHDAVTDAGHVVDQGHARRNRCKGH